MSEEQTTTSGFHPADTNGDGKVSPEEHAMYMEFKRKELEDQDACLLYTSPSPRDLSTSRMPSSA